MFIYRDAYALKIRQKWTKNKPGSERSERIMDEIYAIYTRIIHEKYDTNRLRILHYHCFRVPKHQVIRIKSIML